MNNKYINHKPLQYGKKFYFLEFIAERVIQIIAFLSIGAIIAIFYFVFQEATFAFQSVKPSTKENSEQNKIAPDKSNNDQQSSNIGVDKGAENLKADSYSSEPTALADNSSITEKNNNLKAESYQPEQYQPEEYKPEDNKPEQYKPEEYKPETYKSESESSSATKEDEAKPKTKKQENLIEIKKVPEKIAESVKSIVPAEEKVPEEEALTIKKLLSPNDYIDNIATYIWQPISSIPKYSFIPLCIGALKVTLIGLLLAAPIAILAAIFTVSFAPRWLKEIIKPSIEILAGFPSVVIGFFCLITLASIVQNLFGTTYRLNSFVGGIGMALAVIPIIYTVTEDALSAVPKFMKEASLALGATRWQTAIRVTLPAAIPGVFAAIILGFGRAFGETMIALMATGNAAIVSGDIFESVRTMAATIGAEMAEVEFRSIHYGVLFLIGAVLFVVTFSMNALAEFYVRKKLMKKFQGQ